jgi:hypothetical protein
LKHEYSYELSGAKKKEIASFLLSVPNFSVEHFPDWYLNSGKSYSYHQFYKENTLVGVATVIETKKFLARLQFGPVLQNEEYFSSIVSLLSLYYKQQGFVSLFVQPNIVIDSPKSFSLEISKAQKKQLDIHSWSTIWVDLRVENPTIGYSKHHIRNIKKAEKSNLQFRNINAHELDDFINGYAAMYAKRGLIFDYDSQKQNLYKKYTLLNENKLGDFFGVFNDNQLIGGIVIAYQNKTAFYVLGFTNHQYRNIPVLHFAFNTLLLKLKTEGFATLDLGGYNRFAKPKSQVYEINKFKMGFSTHLVDFTPQIEFVYKPLLYEFFGLVKKIKVLMFKN